MEKDAANTFIPAFYKGRSLFVTGGTGFMGKVLVEKLLRSCPDVAEIFLLIRQKKGLSVNDRLKKMLDNKLFDTIRNERPSSFDKIIPITGDAAAENLGLLPTEKALLIEKVSVIFHVSANVRFDDGLKDAILTNTRSTRDICNLAENFKQLVVLLHVSSTYTQTDKSVVDEILYSSELDYKKAIKIAESVDENILKILTAKFLGGLPNTYTFTKKLAEQVISDYSESLPCVVVRPSIVISTVDEPVKGWLDNFNGPVGMLTGGGKGILRVAWCDPQIILDFMPVDVAIKAILIAAWKRGIKTTEDKTIDVYNCSSNNIVSITIENMIKTGFEITKKYPLENIVYKPRTIIIKTRFFYFILVLLLHILPAVFLDAVMNLLLNTRPMLFKLQRKVYVSNSALSYFTLNDWTFYNKNLIALFDNLSADNKEHFGFVYNDFDIVNYFKNGLIGSKIYLLNEKMDNLEAARRHSKRMDWLDTITTTLFIMIILWILYRKNTFFYIIETFSSLIYCV